MSKSRLIGLVGYARSGKDIAAAALIERGWRRIAFADALREFALKVNPWICYYSDCSEPISVGTATITVRAFDRLAVLVAERGWDDAKKLPDVRQLLIDIGMGVRQCIHPSVWIDAVCRKLDDCETSVVITDCRFRNEAGMVREYGGKVVRIRRPGTEAKGAPDLACDEILPDLEIINDGTIDELQAKLLSFVGV